MRPVANAYADAALAALLLGIVALMIIPIPTPLLDVLIAGNIALGVLMLLVSMAIKDGLAFAAMPTVLLVTTLYRLALNVSSTRLILLQADAGRVIRSFGEYVVRGNYAVGAVVFFILTLIQYVVVARGSERVAEVGARFALDAMPGKQMAIDADLRAGSLDPEGARRRRRLLEREGQFYGAMDGAMKFVKGDAIAGIVITVVNIVAGVGIGVGMRKLQVTESLQLYGLLTIGDGLVCQIPSLLISTSAGLVVTRVASHDESASLGGDVGSQLFGNPRVLALGSAFLGFLALVPGLPLVPFAFLSVLLGAAAYGLQRTRRRVDAGGARLAAGGPSSMRQPAAFCIALGPELGAELLSGNQAPLEAALTTLRESLYAQLGLALPEMRIETRPALPPRRYVVELHELPCAAGELAPGEPLDQADQVVLAVEHAVRPRAADLLSVQSVRELLDALERGAPALVHDTVPKPVTLKLLTDVLRRLLAEDVSIRPLDLILETLGSEAQHETDAGTLTERVRVRLGRQISFAHAHDGVLVLHPLDPMIEDALRTAASISAKSSGASLALPPDQARDIVQAVRSALGQPASPRAALVAQADIRPHLRKLLEHELPTLAILGYAELAPELRVDLRKPVRVGS